MYLCIAMTSISLVKPCAMFLTHCSWVDEGIGTIHKKGQIMIEFVLVDKKVENTIELLVGNGHNTETNGCISNK